MPLPFRAAKKWITKRVIPDYTNQLDLFSEATPETPATVSNAAARTSGFSQGRPRPPEQMHFLEWVPLPPEDAVRTPVAKPPPASTGGDAATVPQPPVRPEIGAQGGISPGTKDGNRGDPSAGKVFDIEPEPKPSRDFHITGAHRIGQGSLQEKARDNIAAIRLLKTLEAENREATDDEKPVLARYVGWGAMPNVFGYNPPGEWRNTAGAVKELLTDDEYQSARASTPNAHFTSPQVIEAIWNGMHHMGLGKGAQIPALSHRRT